jgi:hypothetical protein
MFFFLAEPSFDVETLSSGAWSLLLGSTTPAASLECSTGKELVVRGGEMSDQS